MDALARLEPVARPLLRQIDEALATLGAPPEHKIWGLLRQVGATPADAVTAFVELPGVDESGPLRATSAAMRERAAAYAEATIPRTVPWAGGAGEAYTIAAAALASHLHGGASPTGTTPDREGGHGSGGADGSDGDDSMADRLRATASYVDEVADWQDRSRDRIAHAIADVLTCAQAVSLRAGSSEASASAASSTDVVAAADAGAHVLAAAADALADGADLHRSWSDRLTELPYRAPLHSGPSRYDAAIRLHH